MFYGIIRLSGDSYIQIPWPGEHLLPRLSLQGLWLQLLPSLEQFLCTRERRTLLQKPENIQQNDLTNIFKPGHFKATRELRDHFIQPFMCIHSPAFRAGGTNVVQF